MAAALLLVRVRQGGGLALQRMQHQQPRRTRQPAGPLSMHISNSSPVDGSCDRRMASNRASSAGGRGGAGVCAQAGWLGRAGAGLWLRGGRLLRVLRVVLRVLLAVRQVRLLPQPAQHLQQPASTQQGQGFQQQATT